MKEEQLTLWEDVAFYESGLASHGCLENLDPFAREAIKRYGRHLLNNQEQVTKKLYGVVLHIQEITKHNPIAVIGPNLFEEICNTVNDYEQIYDVREV